MTQLPTFQPGDTVEFCGDEATVIADYGSTVEVKQRTGPKSYTTMSWYKVFQGTPVTLVTPTYAKTKSKKTSPALEKGEMQCRN